MPHDVFISHSSKDKVVADAVCGTLEAAGVRCWIAPRDILPGANWGEAIIDALGSSKAMVLVFSEHSNTSGQVVREVERAINKNIPVIPFRIANVPLSKAMEYFISTAHWLDAFPIYEKHLAVLSQRLVGLIHNQPSTVGSERSPSPAVQPPTHKAPASRLQSMLVGAGVVLGSIAVATWMVTTFMGRRDAGVASQTVAVPAGTTPQDDGSPVASAAQESLKQELANARKQAEELKLKSDQAAKEKEAAETAARLAQQEKERAAADRQRMEKQAQDAAAEVRRLAEEKKKVENESQKAIENMKAEKTQQQAAAAAADARRSAEAALAHALSEPGVDCVWVPIGDPRNKADNTGFGAVAYVFAISRTPITNLQYADFLNTSVRGRTDDTGLFHESMASSPNGGIRRSGEPGSFRYELKPGMGDEPINFVSWHDAARMANWLHNGGTSEADTESGAYLLKRNGSDSPPPAESTASFRLPSEDEWYKAAYFRGGDKRAGYWRYAGGNTWQASADETSYGVFGIARGFGEWNDAVLAGGRRGVRGVGDILSLGDSEVSSADFRGPGCLPDARSPFVGFRLVRTADAAPKP